MARGRVDQPRPFPARLWIIVLAAVAVVVLGLGFALAAFEGDFAPAHEVSVTNDTAAPIEWSCTWSNLHLAPGATGRVRILDRSGEGFACTSSTGGAEVSTCPDITLMKAGDRFTVTSWIRKFTCP